MALTYVAETIRATRTKTPRIWPRRDLRKRNTLYAAGHREVDLLLAANGVWIWATLAMIVWIAIAFLARPSAAP